MKVLAAARAGWGQLRLKARDSARGLQLLHRSGLDKTISPRGAARFAWSALQVKLGPHLATLFHALMAPDKPALVDGKRRLSYADLEAEVNQLARALADLGVDAGDRVAVMLPNRIEHLIAQLAVPRIGASTVEIGYRLKAAEVAYILGNSEPQVVIHDALYAPTIAAAVDLSGYGEQRIVVGGAGHGRAYSELVSEYSTTAPRAAGRATSGGVIVYTSGTTGNPKGADRNLSDMSLSAVVDMMLQVGMRTDDRHLVVCPLYHSAAPAFCGMMFSLGATSIIAEHFDEIAILELIERDRITCAFMVPTMLRRLAAVPPNVRGRFDTSSLRWICSGAAPLPTTTAAAFQDAYGYLLWNFYGATETGLVTLAGPFDHAARPGTVGTALAGNELCIVDDEGEELAVGEIGEVYARNGMLIRGYHKNEDATSRSMRDGFFSVGDLGRLDHEGYLYLESRKHDMIISGGVNIYPREIENYLLTHNSIADVAVVGVDSEDWGQTVKAFIVTRLGVTLTEGELDTFCRNGLADFKRPRLIAFVDELPRNATGKLLKRQLKSQ